MRGPWGSLACARDTPRHAKLQIERGLTFCDFTVPGRKPRPLTLSHPQAKRWKSAKTKPPARHWPRDAVPGKPAHHQHGRHGEQRLEAVGTTPKQRHNHMAAERGKPPSEHGRHRPVCGVARPSRGRTWPFHGGVAPRPSRRHAKGFPSAEPHEGFPSARGRPLPPPWPHLPEAWNRIKASLSVFQRREVKVLGFGVKDRLRPQRIASRGCSDPFALVGAIGKACGEAWVGVFCGSPPGWWCGLPLLSLVCSCVDRVNALTAFMC